jgi:4-carboxymuconolactone decarboxylase
MKLLTAAVTTISMLTASLAQAEGTQAKEDLLMVAPALQKYKQETILGELWKRPALSARDRSIVTLAGLIARNQTIELPFYLNLALDSGVNPAEISEIITHLAFYAGWANALSAARLDVGVDGLCVFVHRICAGIGDRA